MSEADGDERIESLRNDASVMRISTVFFSTVIGFAVVGYLVGIGAGVPEPDGGMNAASLELSGHVASEKGVAKVAIHEKRVIAAVNYADVPLAAMGPTENWSASLDQLARPPYDVFAEIRPNEEDKRASTALRASRRAFNGAPPIIPHSVAGTSDSACFACHSKGIAVSGLRASVMSHGFLANCTQCHAPPAPTPFRQCVSQVANDFRGLPAPATGVRAFPGAPPTIPHTQWMRENCNACHGGPNGWAGMQSTHPDRANCTQCHAPSATLDQAIVSANIPMLPPMELKQQ